MYSPEPKTLPTKSLYYATLLAMVGILSLSFLAFKAISDRMQNIHINPVFDRSDELQLESARDALQSGGLKALTTYMARLDRVFGGDHYLLDSHGIDLYPAKTGRRSFHQLRQTSRVSRRMVTGLSRTGRRTGNTGSPPRVRSAHPIFGPFFPTISSSSARPALFAGWPRWVLCRPYAESPRPSPSSDRAISPCASIQSGKMKSGSWGAPSIELLNNSSG